MYYINDGVYASFNCLFYDHAECTPVLLKGDELTSELKLYKSSIWGPTCDGLDVVVKECFLPELNTGEFMVFKNMGAYTISGAVAFNGIPLARCIYVASTSWDIIKEAFNEPVDETYLNVNGNSSTCAAAASLAFTRCLSSIQQQQQQQNHQQQLEIEELNVLNDSTHLVNLNEAILAGDHRQLVDLDEMLGVTDEDNSTASPVDCAITC